eukprot:scaffold46_cov318-Pavlova_lutheri.AAC.2
MGFLSDHDLPSIVSLRETSCIKVLEGGHQIALNGTDEDSDHTNVRSSWDEESSNSGSFSEGSKKRRAITSRISVTSFESTCVMRPNSGREVNGVMVDQSFVHAPSAPQILSRILCREEATKHHHR